ncbi:MAG: hypothetical protein LAO31_19940 [Acidobacteriia bacterium]|nr:hypothetical protein [Terriglobia bacterium]
MIATVLQHDLVNLLEQAGAKIRGRNRADCPVCKRRRSVAFDESKGVYYCHGQGCGFSGGAVKLAREQGLAHRLTSAEYRELRQGYEQADCAARVLYKRVQAQRIDLLNLLHALGDMEATAHLLGPDSAEAWDALSTVYQERPAILAELTILESASVADVRELLSGPEPRERMIKSVISQGGLTDAFDRFVEIDL